MATLDELIQQNLREYLSGGAAGLEDTLYQTSANDINRQSGDTARNILENTFGRGMGNSSITRDLNSERERVRAEALIRARSEAAGASRSAILAALAQGAGVQQRQQQAGQFGQTLDFQKKALKQSQETANNQALMTGVGGLAGAALQTGGLIYGPEIKNTLRGLTNPGSLRPGDVSVSGQLGGDLSGATSPSLDALANSGQIPDLSVPDFQIPDMSVPDFQLPDVGSSFNFDPGALDFGSTLDLLARMPDWQS